MRLPNYKKLFEMLRHRETNKETNYAETIYDKAWFQQNKWHVAEGVDTVPELMKTLVMALGKVKPYSRDGAHGFEYTFEVGDSSGTRNKLFWRKVAWPYHPPFKEVTIWPKITEEVGMNDQVQYCMIRDARQDETEDPLLITAIHQK